MEEDPGVRNSQLFPDLVVHEYCTSFSFNSDWKTQVETRLGSNYFPGPPRNKLWWIPKDTVDLTMDRRTQTVGKPECSQAVEVFAVEVLSKNLPKKNETTTLPKLM